MTCVSAVCESILWVGLLVTGINVELFTQNFFFICFFCFFLQNLNQILAPSELTKNEVPVAHRFVIRKGKEGGDKVATAVGAVTAESRS